MFLQLLRAKQQAYRHHINQHFPSLLTPRTIDSHKGTFGNVAIIGGTTGMSGAVVLAAQAALMNGCGRVWLGFCQETTPIPFVVEQPELMLQTAGQLQSHRDLTTIGIGCGMGTHATSEALLKQWLIMPSQHKVLDADALNILAKWQTMPNHNGLCVLTPHPLEAARLLQTDTDSINTNRLAAAHSLAQQYQAWVVLKGHQTIVCNPNGWFYQNNSGSPALATAGSGDVLTGMISSLLAQGLIVGEAICAAVWLHGAAAEILQTNGIGPIGLTAHEIAGAARFIRNQLIYSEQV